MGTVLRLIYRNYRHSNRGKRGDTVDTSGRGDTLPVQVGTVDTMGTVDTVVTLDTVDEGIHCSRYRGRRDRVQYNTVGKRRNCYDRHLLHTAAAAAGLYFTTFGI